MSDTRAAIRELRSLSEKRSTQGLTEQERSRLAELRERLGLPSEPAAGQPGGPQPGGTVAPSPPVAASPAAPPSAAPALSSPGAPVAAASLPRLDGTGVTPLPRLDVAVPALVAPELGGPPPPRDEEPTLEALPELETAEPVPAIEPESRLDTNTDPAIRLRAFDEASTTGVDPTEGPLPEIEPGAALDEQPELAAAEPLAEPVLEPLEMAPAEPPAEPVLESLELAAVESPPEPVLEPLEMAAEPPAEPVLESLEMAALEPPLEPVLEPVEMAALEALTEPTLEPPDMAAAELPVEPELEAATDLGPGQLTPEELGAAPLAPDLADSEAALAPEPVPRRLTLAERIDAAAGGQPSEPMEPMEPAAAAEAAGPEALEGGASDGWGAVPVAPEPLVPEELGMPLDDADPAELGFGGDGAPIELSSADVILLENESALEMELSGEPADPVPLAALHEFVGAQPEDPRALALDDPGEEPTFAPEDLQASEAELAAEPEAFQATSLVALPELPDLPVLDPEAPAPPPAPAAPRIVVPKPPPAAPRPAAAATAPERAVPPSPPPPPPAARAVAAPARAAGLRSVAAPAGSKSPPPPPPAAYVMGEDGRRLPALSAARPEPPHLAHQFGGSGPFVRNKPVLLSQAPLDVMADADAPALPEPTPPPPPATDVATGAEVFGGTYLNPTFVEGEHRVVLHTLEGQVRRGLVKDLDLLDPVIRLAQPGRPPEAIPADRVKAIFFMLEPGTQALPSTGRRIRVGFADGRQIVGFSEDVDAGEQGFFLVPADTRTHTARIYVFRAGIQSISAA
jgi:Family of unknown function (DUF6982)